MTSLQPSPDELRAYLRDLEAFSESVLRAEGSRASDFLNVNEAVLSLQEDVPHRAQLSELLQTLELAASKGMNHLHPGFLAYIPIAGAPISAVADYISSLLNRYVGVQWASPAMAQLEWNALRWVSSAFGYPPEASGVFTSGGSLANFTAVVTARHAKLGNSYSQGRIYLTDQTHLSIERSLRMAGFSPECVVSVPTDRALRMDVAALRDLLQRDASDDLRPFLVVANAGTVNIGAVDPIEDMVEVAAENNLWVHVDGAYGGAFVLTEFGKAALRGIAQADSITMDPHKGLFLSMGMGCVLVRDGESMRAAHLGEADYLRVADASNPVPNFADYSLELTRPFRGLRLWMALKLLGWEPFIDALNINRSLALKFYDWLSEDNRFEAPWRPDLSTVAFRLDDDSNDETASLMEAVNREGRVFLSATTISSKTYIRACFLSHRTSEGTLKDLISDLNRLAS